MNHVLSPDRRLPALLATLLVALGLAVAPASAEVEKELVLVDHWFHGEDTDQLHKADRLAPGATPFDSRTPTFSEDEPDGDTIMQHSSGFRTVQDSEHVGSAEGAYWVGPFEGEVGGDLELRLHVSGATPMTLVQGGAAIHVTVWADPDWDAGEGTLLGEVVADIVPGLDEPNLESVTVPVAGFVDSEIVVQVNSTFFLHTGMTFNYGSAEHDSGFTLPVLVPVED